jgi:hypothetical protein
MKCTDTEKGCQQKFRVVSRNGSKRNINITRTDDHEYTQCWADFDPSHWAVSASVDRVHCLFQTTDNALSPDIETVGAMIFKKQLRSQSSGCSLPRICIASPICCTNTTCPERR